MTQDYEMNEGITTTRTYNMDANSLHMRLNPEPVLKQIETYLRGSEVVYFQDEKGEVVTKNTRSGKPKANLVGIPSILNYVAMAINTQVVQGNFPSDKTGYSWEYEKYIYDFRVNLGEYIFINMDEFNVDENEYGGIIDSIMNIIIPYMTRLIDNLERKSYAFEKTDSTQATTRGKDGIKIFSN